MEVDPTKFGRKSTPLVKNKSKLYLNNRDPGGVCATFVRARKSTHVSQFSVHTVSSCYNCCTHPRSTSRCMQILVCNRTVKLANYQLLILHVDLKIRHSRSVGYMVTNVPGICKN